MVQEVAGSSPVFHPKFKKVLEFEFTCPYCWESQFKFIDPLIENQSFIEDCETCCNPISFNIIISNNSIIHSDVLSIEQ